MNTSVTLTADEFRRLHNAICFLRSDNVDESIKTMREALSGAYDQVNQDFDRKFDHYENVKSQFGFDTIWSMYEIEDLDLRHPYSSDAIVCYQGQHVPVTGINWTDVYRAADQAIRDSGDDHHIFIEGFRLKNGNELHLITGS